MTDAPEWVSGIENEALRGSLSQFESQDKLFEAIGYKPPVSEPGDWRALIKDEDAKKFSERYTDIDSLTKSALDLRKQLSTAIVRPGKDADEKQISAYRKAMGVPEKIEEYEFPELSKEQLTDEIKASRATWAKRFHDLQVPKETAKVLSGLLNEDITKAEQSQLQADQEFARTQEDALRADWKGDYDKNKALANRAFREIGERTGLKLDDLTKIETKDGRFLMDRADMVRLFATIGREMAEGTLGPALTDSERDTLEDQIRDLRKQIQEAQSKGESKRANQLYQKELSLVAKRDGDQAIVGAGKAA